MKKYYKYKNFMPIDFVNKKRYEEDKGNTRGISLIIILNLFLLPLNIKFILNNNKEEVIVENKVETSNKICIEEIESWIKIYSDEIVSLKVDSKKGEIIVGNESNIDFLTKGDFEISKINYEENNKSIKVRYDKK